jgi:Terminase large subunit, T4likevirus-type, N-terminal
MLTGYATLERQAAAISRDLRLLQQAASPPLSRTAVEMATDLGIALDPWQADALTTPARDILLLCSRQAGKSLVAALLALREAVYRPGSLVLALSPSERQSKRLLRVIRRYYAALQRQAPAISEGVLGLELRNGSEIHALPGREGTIRGFSEVDLLIIDEAARVADDLYASVRPMLAISQGRLIALSTPFGKRGFFHREWTEGGPDWHRAKVTAYDVPRIPVAWLEAERARIGDFWFLQEYGCQFMDSDDQLYATDLVLAAVSREVASLGLPRFGG